VPGYVSVIGSATNSARVTLWGDNGAWATTSRKGDYFRGELAVTNSSPLWLTITNVAVLNGGMNADTVTNIIGHALWTQSPESFTYDADGNLTSDSLWTNFWNAENRLIATESRAGLPTLAKRRVEYTYDYQGRMIQRVVFTHSGTIYEPSEMNRFVYDGVVQLVELDGGNDVVKSYMRGLDLSGTMQGAGGVGGLLAVSAGESGTHFYCHDGNGNVRALVNASSGALSAEYDYTPFGAILRATGEMAFLNTLDFSDQYTDKVTGRILYLYRPYDPDSGRWLSRDPIGEQGGQNLYLFVGNDPAKNIDILGEYSLHFKGNWKFSERVAVFQAFNGVEDQLPGFMSFIEDEVQKFEKVDPTCCPYSGEWLQALRKLLVQMKRQYSDMIGSQKLDLRKKSIPGVSARSMFDKKTRAPIWEIQISTAPEDDFFSQHLDENIGSIFHETSHYVGTEDENVPETENAHTLEKIFAFRPYDLSYPENAIARKYGYRAGCQKMKGTE
jgi:RHS repeat-associated protein